MKITFLYVRQIIENTILQKIIFLHHLKKLHILTRARYEYNLGYVTHFLTMDFLKPNKWFPPPRSSKMPVYSCTIVQSKRSSKG